MNTKRRMKSLKLRGLRISSALLLTMLVGGCAGYTQSKVDLVAQAQTGVKRVRDALAERGASDTPAFRDRLDAAFDDDVTRRDAANLDNGGLTAAWVIEHRKAYVAALDAFAAARRESAARADDGMVATLEAVSLLLAQLQQMHATEQRLSLPEWTPTREVRR